MNEIPAIDWQAIQSSEIWKREIEPWLKDMEESFTETLLNVPHVESVDYWRGHIAAIRAMRTTPDNMMQINRMMKQQEAENESIRREAGRARTRA